MFVNYSKIQEKGGPARFNNINQLSVVSISDAEQLQNYPTKIEKNKKINENKISQRSYFSKRESNVNKSTDSVELEEYTERYNDPTEVRKEADDEGTAIKDASKYDIHCPYISDYPSAQNALFHEQSSERSYLIQSINKNSIGVGDRSHKKFFRKELSLKPPKIKTFLKNRTTGYEKNLSIKEDKEVISVLIDNQSNGLRNINRRNTRNSSLLVTHISIHQNKNNFRIIQNSMKKKLASQNRIASLRTQLKQIKAKRKKLILFRIKIPQKLSI